MRWFHPPPSRFASLHVKRSSIFLTYGSTGLLNSQQNLGPGFGRRTGKRVHSQRLSRSRRAPNCRPSPLSPCKQRQAAPSGAKDRIEGADRRRSCCPPARADDPSAGSERLSDRRTVPTDRSGKACDRSAPCLAQAPDPARKRRRLFAISVRLVPTTSFGSLLDSCLQTTRRSLPRQSIRRWLGCGRRF